MLLHPLLAKKFELSPTTHSKRPYSKFGRDRPLQNSGAHSYSKRRGAEPGRAQRRVCRKFRVFYKKRNSVVLTHRMRPHVRRKMVFMSPAVGPNRRGTRAGRWQHGAALQSRPKMACQHSNLQRPAAFKAASTSQGRTMSSGSHVEGARLGPGCYGRACESKSDACTHPCCARRRRSTTLRGLSDAPLKRAASALDRFEKRPMLRPGARPQLSSRAPFLPHGQPVRRPLVRRAREDQPTPATMAHKSCVLAPAPHPLQRQRNPAWRQWHHFQDRSAEQRDRPQLLLSKVQRKAQSGEQNRKLCSNSFAKVRSPREHTTMK